MAIRNLNGEFPPSSYELSFAPPALDHVEEVSSNGHNETVQLSPEARARFARDYRRTTASLEGGDRDKRRAFKKTVLRLRHSYQAGNVDGILNMFRIIRRAHSKRNGNS